MTFALLHLLSSDFTSSHLLFICFSTLHIVGSLLFKFPSTMCVSKKGRQGAQINCSIQKERDAARASHFSGFLRAITFRSHVCPMLLECEVQGLGQ